MDPQVRTQPVLHPVDEQPANVVHVHVGQHHVGHGREIDAGGLQSLGQLPGPREVRTSTPSPASMRMVRPPLRTTTAFSAQSNIVRRQEHVVQPGRPDGRVGVGRHHRAWQR